MGARHDDLAVDFIDEFGDSRGRARSDLTDGADAVLFIARVDTLRAVACKKILVELQARHTL